MMWKDFWEMTCQVISCDMNGTTWIFAMHNLCSHVQQLCNSTEFPRKRKTQYNHRKRIRHLWWLPIDSSWFWHNSKKHQLRLGTTAPKISTERPFPPLRCHHQACRHVQPFLSLCYPCHTPLTPTVYGHGLPLYFITYIFHLSQDNQKQKKKGGLGPLVPVAWWKQWGCPGVTATW